MDFAIGLVAAMAFSVSAAGYCWLRRPKRAMADGERCEAEERLAAFGATGDWV